MLRLVGTGRVHGAVVALEPVSLAVDPGTVTAVVGANGSGKSTLLRLAAGVLEPSSGWRDRPGRSLYLLGGHGARAAESAIAAVTSAAALAGTAPAGTARAQAVAALAVVGLGERSNRSVRSLSSGERARVTLAVALACRADLICLDEPTAHLDETGAGVVPDVLVTLRGRGSAVLVATHDPERFGWPVDAILRLDAGRVTAPAATSGWSP